MFTDPAQRWPPARRRHGGRSRIRQANRSATIQRLHHAALAIVPKLKDARILEDWAGLRPGTPDALPILGATATPGYYVATGHFRDGILLAPITAEVMADVIKAALQNMI